MLSGGKKTKKTAKICLAYVVTWVHVNFGNANGPCKHKTQTCLTSKRKKRKNSTCKLACYHISPHLYMISQICTWSPGVSSNNCVRSLFKACMPLSFALLFRNAVTKHYLAVASTKRTVLICSNLRKEKKLGCGKGRDASPVPPM